MMVCTAGHVDHGKTELVKMLTGCRTDRLKIEQERGMTIDLGFAPCFLGDNLCVGIVDVPGHEKFVRNMVAGVSGIELAILVIAADDGVMPQTVEHLQIMELLGVRSGVVALTKTDLVPPDAVEQRCREIREFLRGSFLADAPLCPVSSRTFDGYPAFYDTLVDRIRASTRRATAGIFRMPIERVFAQEGFGTIVTGIPISGTVSTGDRIAVTPGGLEGEIRGIQRFLRDATEGGWGQCLALNVPDLDRSRLARGQVVSPPDYLRAARFFHVRLHAVPGIKPPLRNAEEVTFHAGTIEHHGKLYLLEGPALEAGKSMLATVALEEPAVAVPGDRFIIRRPSPASTAGGGAILAVSYTPERPRKKDILAHLRGREDFFRGVDFWGSEGLARRIEYCLAAERPAGADLATISRATLVAAETARATLSQLQDKNVVLALSPNYYVHAQRYEECLQEIVSRLQRRASEGGALSVDAAEVRSDLKWAPPLWDRIEQDLAARRIAVARAGKWVLQDSAQHMPESDRALMTRLLDVYETTCISTAERTKAHSTPRSKSSMSRRERRRP